MGPINHPQYAVPVHQHIHIGIFDGILTPAAEKLQDLETPLKVYAVVISFFGAAVAVLATITLLPTFPIALLPLVGVGGFMLSFYINADIIRAAITLIKKQ